MTEPQKVPLSAPNPPCSTLSRKTGRNSVDLQLNDSGLTSVRSRQESQFLVGVI
jgi:hypothetical protein